MEVNVDTLKSLLSHFHDDQDMIDGITDALEAFEQYHAAIYALEIKRSSTRRGPWTRTPIGRRSPPWIKRARCITTPC